MLQLIENTITWENLIANFSDVHVSSPIEAFGPQVVTPPCTRALTPREALATLSLRQPLDHRILVPTKQRHAQRSPRRNAHGHRSNAQSF
jgi:hypothetical protein